METILSIAFIILSAFFSVMGIGFVARDKQGPEPDQKQPFHLRVLSLFSGNPRQYMATVIIGKYISLVMYGIFFFKSTGILFRFIHPELLALFIQAILASFLFLIIAELLPGLLLRNHSGKILRTFSVPMVIFFYLFYPLSGLLNRLSGFSGPAGETEDPYPGRLFFSNQEPASLSKEQNSPNPQESELENEVKLFRNAMDFSKVKLREIMVPRTEIAALDINSSLEDLRQKFIETGYSRILFYQDNIDNVIGYIHHSTIFSNPESIRSALKTVLIVPETMSASKLLSIFIQQHRSIAIVVDEFGGTSGMVTSEDILEEIFGEIEDEHDTTDWIEKQLSDDEFIFSARIDLDVLNEKYNLQFPLDENYETLAGYILYYHESIPKVNSLITIGNYRFKILKATSTRIDLVNLKIISKQ